MANTILKKIHKMKTKTEVKEVHGLTNGKKNEK